MSDLDPLFPRHGNSGPAPEVTRPFRDPCGIIAPCHYCSNLEGSDDGGYEGIRWHAKAQLHEAMQNLSVVEVLQGSEFIARATGQTKLRNAIGGLLVALGVPP